MLFIKNVQNPNFIILFKNENKMKRTYLKENVFTSDAANSVKNDLIQVVENPEGTANDMKISGVTIVPIKMQIIAMCVFVIGIICKI